VTENTVNGSKIAAELAKKGKNLLSASRGMIANDPPYLANQKFPKIKEMDSTYYTLLFFWLRPSPYYQYTHQSNKRHVFRAVFTMKTALNPAFPTNTPLLGTVGHRRAPKALHQVHTRVPDLLHPEHCY